MLVHGDKVTKEQALEIIRRTDTFFLRGYGGNARDFNKAAWEILRYPQHPSGDHDWCEVENARGGWLKEWGIVETEYVHNSWISSSYIGGPYGWCNPSGVIHYTDNIGKWPSATDVYTDWLVLAKAFPFLNLTAILMDGEQFEDDRETKPVIGFFVANGRVEILWDPSHVHWIPIVKELSSAEEMIRDFSVLVNNPQARECYFSLEQIKAWRDQVDGLTSP